MAVKHIEGSLKEFEEFIRVEAQAASYVQILFIYIFIEYFQNYKARYTYSSALRYM